MKCRKSLEELNLKIGDKVFRDDGVVRIVDEIDNETQQVMLLCASGVVVPEIFQNQIKEYL
jgi:hypothetical protein